MEHEKQVEVVKQALDLETQIQVLEQFLPEERAETYAEPEPQPPVRQEAHYTEPPIRHGCKVNWLLMLGPAGITLALSTFSNSAFLMWMFVLTLFVWVPVYYFALYRKQKAATIEKIRNSAEYQQQCTAARMAANRQQDFNEAYAKAKEEYDSVLLPRYQTARSAWEAEHQAQIRKEEQELAQAKKELAALYGETRIVPAQYRRVDALQYIYDMVSTSDYDVRQAIEYFDKSQQRALCSGTIPTRPSKSGWRNKQRRQVYHLPPYAFYWGWEKMRSLHDFLQGNMIQCAPDLVRQIFIVAGTLLIPQHGDGVGFGGMGLGKRPDQRQPVKIRPGHSKIEIPVSGYGVI